MSKVDETEASAQLEEEAEAVLDLTNSEDERDEEMVVAVVEELVAGHETEEAKSVPSAFGGWRLSDRFPLGEDSNEECHGSPTGVNGSHCSGKCIVNVDVSVSWLIRRKVDVQRHHFNPTRS